MRFLVFFFSFVLLSCSKQAVKPVEQVIAKVNGEPVYAKEFLVNFSQLKAEQDEISQKNPKVLEQLKTRALNEVLILFLVRQEATKKQIRIGREMVETRLTNWKDGYPPGGFEEMLKKQNSTEDLLRHRIEDQLLIEKIVESLFSNETLVSDEEVKKYFSLHEKEFFKPERVHAFQIVVPTKEEAEKIRQEITSGHTSFESAARSRSMSPDASKGGDLGFFSKNEKIDAFNEAFNLPLKVISKPIESRYGVHLLKVVEKHPSKKLSLNEAKADIVRLLKKDKESRVYKEWVNKLLKDGEIYRNEAVFNHLS